MGSEWMIIIFVALIVLLGTNRLPEVSRKLGRVVGEYTKAKNDIQKQFQDFSNSNLEISGPVKDEREKLEVIAKSFGINSVGKTTDELKEIIASKIGKQDLDPQDEKNS
jgi:sec-independent protein translocase protein TatA